ncbi:sulfotransferase family protein [Rheinheimera baltica]|uniref:sulfotransferase family protein n=1 Tax=Rheinheimera baltica TaxID=67576 RepID=UPI0004065498|nr:sulfotransferase family protein [Rheinheimera baltica]
MSKQPQQMLNLGELQLQLQQALALIENNNINKPDVALTDLRSFHNTESLLQRCEQVVQASQPQKPILRIIHHFACSGGTLISKCIAAQPNVFLLSELHPTTLLGFNSNKGTYTPRDIVTQALYSRIPDVDTLAETVFVQNVIETERHVRERGGYLVLRAHTHADYCTNAAVPEIDSLTRLLSPHFDIKHLVTVRNPIDSFLSLRQNGWVHFKPDSFDEYCGRLLKFLNAFSDEQIVKYEDFVEQPATVVKTCLQKLELPNVEHGLDYIDVFKVSGDSGRTGSEILIRPQRETTEIFREEIKKSEHYDKFLQFQKRIETI